MRISLTNLEFFGYHGLYEEEKKIGNTFFVDVHVELLSKDTIIDHINQTIDYVDVYHLVRSVMLVPTPLLETLVGTIAHQIVEKFPMAIKVQVAITKQKLPIAHFEGNTTVSIEKSRN
jgi:dihydroneopterin aldolase